MQYLTVIIFLYISTRADGNSCRRHQGREVCERVLFFYVVCATIYMLQVKGVPHPECIICSRAECSVAFFPVGETHAPRNKKAKEPQSRDKGTIKIHKSCFRGGALILIGASLFIYVPGYKKAIFLARQLRLGAEIRIVCIKIPAQKIYRYTHCALLC